MIPSISATPTRSDVQANLCVFGKDFDEVSYLHSAFAFAISAKEPQPCATIFVTWIDLHGLVCFGSVQAIVGLFTRDESDGESRVETGTSHIE